MKNKSWPPNAFYMFWAGWIGGIAFMDLIIEIIGRDAVFDSMKKQSPWVTWFLIVIMFSLSIASGVIGRVKGHPDGR